MTENLKNEILKSIEATEEVLKLNMETNFDTYCEMKANLQYLAYLVTRDKK